MTRSQSGKSIKHQLLSLGLIRKRGEMNKTETEYADLLATDPAVADFWFEPFSLRLSHPPEGQPATLTPDFLVLMKDGLTFVDDVKGTGKDDKASIVRMKCAAEQFTLWQFRICKKQTTSQGGGFKIHLL